MLKWEWPCLEDPCARAQFWNVVLIEGQFQIWLLALLLDGNELQLWFEATGTNNKLDVWPWAMKNAGYIPFSGRLPFNSCVFI